MKRDLNAKLKTGRNTKQAQRAQRAKKLTLALIASLVLGLSAAGAGQAAGEFKPFSIYSDESAPDNHFASTGWMGDYADITVDGAFTVNPHAGSTSIKVTYSKMASQGAGWAGVYWQEPANNWGNRPGGFDLTGAAKLTFWARGDKGGETINEFKMGGIKGQYPDSGAAGIGPVVLTTEWKQYTIDLAGKDLTNVIGGFCWASALDKNPNGAVFYLDDIRYE